MEMKQILILEPDEVKRLHKGKTLMINTGSGEVGIQFSENGVAKKDAEEEAGEFKCSLCGKSTTKAGKPFNAAGLAIHRAKVHPHERGGRLRRGNK